MKNQLCHVPIALLLAAALLAAGPALAGMAYTKIANSGVELDDSAVLGNSIMQWACTRENATGLVWEVKSSNTPPDLRDWMADISYTNYDSSYDPPNSINKSDNSLGFATRVNATELCGYRDWHLPSQAELLRLVDNTRSTPPRISPDFFPNTTSTQDFWSDTPDSADSSKAGLVSFNTGTASYDFRNYGNAVRLVRGRRSGSLVGLSVGTLGSGAGSVSATGLFCSREGGRTLGDCWNLLEVNSSITLTARPAAGSILSGWGGGACSGTALTCVLTMNAAKTVTVNFSPATTASSIVIDPVTPATLYAALEGAGVYRSADSGAHWSAAATQPASLNLKALVIKPGSPAILYAATYGAGVFISNDSALNWTACVAQPGNPNLLSLAIDASGRLYAGSEAGVFVSSNGCDTWTALNTGLP